MRCVKGPEMKPANRSRGIAAVELALLLAPLLILAFGITEYGRAVHDYNTIVKSTRDAARYLSLNAPGDAAAIARARNLVVFGQVTATGRPLVAGLTNPATQVHVADAVSDPAHCYLQATGSGNVNLVRVSVDGVTFTSAVPAVVSNLVFGPISVTMGQVL